MLMRRTNQFDSVCPGECCSVSWEKYTGVVSTVRHSSFSSAAFRIAAMSRAVQ